MYNCLVARRGVLEFHFYIFLRRVSICCRASLHFYGAYALQVQMLLSPFELAPLIRRRVASFVAVDWCEVNERGT